MKNKWTPFLDSHQYSKVMPQAQSPKVGIYIQRECLYQAVQQIMVDCSNVLAGVGSWLDGKTARRWHGFRNKTGLKTVSWLQVDLPLNQINLWVVCPQPHPDLGVVSSTKWTYSLCFLVWRGIRSSLTKVMSKKQLHAPESTIAESLTSPSSTCNET